MFNTKLEVDKHVETCLKNIKNDTERNLRCFAFARLYYKVGEYEQARRYVSNYLITSPRSCDALKFLGETLEKQGKIEAAIDAYRTSLDVDPKQNMLLLKVCELLSSEKIPVDISSLQYYCEKAQRIYPQNPIVYNLRERLVAAQSEDPNDVTKLLLTELETRSTDVQLRVRLLRHLLQNNHIKEAYKHASDIEWKSMPIFLNSLNWYEVVSEVLVRYQRENVTNSSLTWEFWMLFVTVLDKLAALTLNEHFNNIKSSSECTLAVFNLDQTLTVAANNVSGCNERPLVQEFLSHYRAQLCFHLSTLLFKQAKSDLIKYKDALNMSLPLLFIAFHTQPVELHSLWLDHSPEVHRLQVQKWHREAAFRCSQAGHILLSAAKDRKVVVMEKVVQHSSGMWREQLFKKLFITRDEQNKMKTSYFVTCPQLIDIPSQLPEITDLSKYDEYAQAMHPDSLHNLVWICANKKLSSFKCTIFEGLQYSVKNLNNCSAESLNVLDIESFIYLTTLTALGQDDNKMYYNGDKPPLIPASITDHLGTLNQAKWFKTAYKIYKNEYGINLSEVRLNLIKGIEVVRCVGNHGIDVKLLVTLANTFMERAKKLTRQSEIEFNEARADLYWKAALPILEKLQKNQAVTYGMNRMFGYKSKDLSQFDIAKYLDEGRLFNGVQMMKRKEFEKALQVFDSLKNPYAAYYQAQIYKTMAEEQLNQNKENVTSEMRSQHVILLSRSRDCYYLTLDRLRDPAVDRKHPLNKQLGTEIEKIERLLSRFDSDVYARNDCDGLSDENVSSVGSIGDHANNFYSSTMYPSESLTPHLDRTPYSNRYRLELPSRREARPSPERLDAQLRQMQASRDATLGHIIEQNRLMVESHRNLMEEFRWLKDAVANINSSVTDVRNSKTSGREELQSIKDSISELKTVVEEFQNFRDVTDLVHEMKKEIAELKKDQAKSKNQLSEEDLYVLDDEYTGDYGINANATGFNPTNLYPNYPGRLPPTYPPAAALYPGMYPVYPYPNLGIPQGSLGFGQESQISDFRGLNLPQPGYGQPSLPQAKPAWDLTHPNLAQLNLMQPVVVPQLQPPTTQQSNLFRVSTAPSVSVTSNIFSSVTATSTNSEAPINIVITSSDPLPKTTVTTTQVLSVTIPPQHIKGNLPPKTTLPHNYQIPLPASYSSMLNTTASIVNQPPAVTNVNLGLQIEKSLNQSFSTTADTTSKANTSSTSVEEDPMPDFKPIVPLPNEVPVNTGEENEIVVFSNRAKLLSYVNNEWKERGIGVFKILEDKDTGKIRILMRRDQVHKICANHFLTPEMNFVRRNDNNLAFVWSANDFSDQQLTAGTFCARFKTEDIANDFFAAVQKSQEKLRQKATPVVEKAEVKSKPAEVKSKPAEVKSKPAEEKTEVPAPSLGGFTFTSTPTFKPKEDVTPTKDPVVTEAAKSSPFASFTFGSKPATPIAKLFSTSQPSVTSKVNEVENEEEVGHFEPAVEFKPVVPLPDLIDVKTGEENAEILFECHAKLLKYDTPSREWKECGVGIMKLLKERSIRLVMRRDQVLKVCCNHQLLKNMSFSKMPNTTKAFSWCAQDFSDESLKAEIFTIRFKSEEQANAFYNAVTSAQELLDENNMVKSEEKVAILEIKDNKEVETKTKEDKKVKGDQSEDKKEAAKSTGWSDKPKSKTGWKCKNCFVHNEAKDHYCITCETPKSNTTPKKTTEPVFSFGVSPPVSTSPAINKSQFSFGTPSSTAASTSFVFAQKLVSWGDAFKVKEGSWECPSCYVRNEPDVGTCTSCGHTKKESEKTEPPVSSWGDQFKPKPGSWECQHCLIRNDSEKLYCVSCDNPKDDTVPKKENKVESSGVQFKFGIPSAEVKKQTEVPVSSWGDQFKPKAGSWECQQCLIRNDSEKLYCVSCDNPKDDTVPKKENKVESSGVQFKFGMPSAEVKKQTEVPVSSWGDQFKPKAGSWECQQCLIRNDSEKLYCVSCENPKDDTVPKKENKVKSGGVQFKFGMPSTTTTTAASTTASFSVTTQPATSFTFGSKPADAVKKFSFPVTTTATSTTTDESKDRFVFGSPQQHAFEFTPRSPRRLSSGGREDESDSFVEDEGDHIHFKPVIPLPDKIDVKTGEESEQVLYCHRAKLFRFVDGEWKERGIGDLKILLNTETNKLRVLMRREQVLKICLNHTLTASVEYLPKDDKTWLFTAPDYSEGEINHWQFCLRFKLPEVAQAFKKAVDDALKKTSSKSTASESLKPPTEDTSEVEFVSETQVSPEEEQEAIRLQLPPKFMSYRQLSDCSCETCKKEDFILNELFKKELFKTSEDAFSKPGKSSILAKPKLFFSPETSKTETEAFKSFSFTLKTETETTPSITTSITSSVFSTPTKSPFATINFTSPSTSGGNLFGDPKSTNVFGASTSIFGNAFNLPFGDQAEAKKEEPSILKCDSTLSFTNLPAANAGVGAFEKKFDSANPFAHLGSGAPVFASLAKTEQKKEGDEAEGSDNEGGENYDPHYDPIVPLPEAIVVSTGEEDEVPIFNERTKLYRYDNVTKEWKERGVGQMKILHHPGNGTYRFILRREQVHKVVLNMLITPSIDLQPMVTSDRAWLWCGYNHLDEGPQLEKLAARFKLIETAVAFKKAAETAIAAVKEQRDKNLPSTIQNFGDASEEHSDGRDDEEDEEDGGDDEEEEDDDEEERAVLFMKPCQLQEEDASFLGQWSEMADGNIIIYYDPDVSGSRICMYDESGAQISETIIGSNTEMTIDDNVCIWKAVEWADANPRWHSLKAVFPTYQDAEEFHCRYVESLQFAQENGLVDHLATDAGE